MLAGMPDASRKSKIYMAEICPAVLAESIADYKSQIANIASFARRIQIDLSDGIFTPHKTVEISEIFWPTDILADLHVMYRRPHEVLDLLISKQPHMVIVHVESESNLLNFFNRLHENSIKTGLAFLPETNIGEHKDLLRIANHAMIFSGSLGEFGGQADLDNLRKIQQIKDINKNIEIGWDGGANDHNTSKLIANGVDVINVGGYIQKAPDPKTAYAILQAIVSKQATP